MARTYKDMRTSSALSAERRDIHRQNKADYRMRTSVIHHFGANDVAPSRLTRNERPNKLAYWRLEGRSWA